MTLNPTGEGLSRNHSHAGHRLWHSIGTCLARASLATLSPPEEKERRHLWTRWERPRGLPPWGKQVRPMSGAIATGSRSSPTCLLSTRNWFPNEQNRRACTIHSKTSLPTVRSVTGWKLPRNRQRAFRSSFRRTIERRSSTDFWGVLRVDRKSTRAP